MGKLISNKQYGSHQDDRSRVPEVNTPENTLPPRLPPRRPPVVSRDPTDSVPAQSPSEKSANSSLPPSSPSRSPPKPTWSVSSKTPTSAPSTPRELPSCPRTCNSPAESVERDLEHPLFDTCLINLPD